MWEKKQFFECDCHSSEHVIAFSVDEYNGELPTLYLEVQLIQYKPWYKRIWPAIKYLFNVKPSCGHWDSWMLNPEDISRLQDMLLYVKEKDRLCQESIGQVSKNVSNNTVN